METKDELIHRIGGEILRGEALAGNDGWSDLSFVASFRQDSKSDFFGYAYLEKDQSDKELEFRFFQPIKGSELEKAIYSLREQMSKEFEVEWSQARFRISKPELRIQTDFEYDDSTRWLPSLEEPLESFKHARVLRC